jgi:uncharacterized membrane protein YfcA
VLTLFFTSCFVFLGYLVYGLTGFGASIVALPLIAQVIPLKLAVVLMVVMDLIAGFLFGLKNRRDVSFAEVRQLLLWAVLGMVLGVTLLVKAPESLLLVILGAFAVFQSGRNLLSRPVDFTPIGSGWRLIYGTLGGVFSALYGTGGPIYVIYIARRVASETVRRATVAFLIFILGFGRLGLFVVAGLLFDPRLLPYLAVCLPACLLAVYTGSWLRKRLHVRHLNQLVWIIVGIAGLSLLIRHLPVLVQQ